MTPEEIEAEWEKTRDIDNPLSPWVQKYKGELNLEEGDTFHDRPPLDLVIKKFRAAKLTSCIAGIAFTVLFVGIWPGSMLTVNILDVKGFLASTWLSRGWAYIAATFIIIVPLVQEFSAILRQHRQNKKIQSLDGTENKQNGTIIVTDGVQDEGGIKDERIITSGGVPKNVVFLRQLYARLCDRVIPRN
jgi:hypothetical protein